jgi:glycosyltransferase involved in cell wall biosynthesis
LNVNVAGHEFYYLKGALRYLLSKKPDTIICTGVDFHQIHTLLIFVIFRLILRKNFFWWSHATLGNQGPAGAYVRKLIYKSSTGILAYSQKGRDNLLRMGIQTDNICVVNNSLNKSDYGFLNTDISKPPFKDPVKIIFCGRITKSKKLDLLVKALNIIHKTTTIGFHCDIIGAGNTTSLKEEVIRLQLSDRIIFHGAVYDNELASFLIKADLMVYPGGIGLSIVQALSYGIPVITTDNQGLQMPEIELLVPDKNGSLYKDDSAEDLAAKIMLWRAKLENSGNEISQYCIASIKEKGYLPEVVSELAINFLKNKLSK